MQPLEQLQKRLKGLIIKRPGMAIGLWGEAGIGKTHAAKQLLQESNCKTLSLHANVTLANLARALPKPKKPPVWAERILEKLERKETLSTEQSTSALGAIFSGIAPFILHLEDVHEASVERLEWIQALAQTVKRLKGVALILTSRSEPSEPFEAVRLEKLDFGAVKTLLESEARASLPTEALEWIHGKAAGNALFTLEFFRLLARQGFVWNDGERWRWRVPGQDLMPVTVEALLEQALKETTGTPELEAVLGAKAVLGQDCSDELWTEVAGLEFRIFKNIRIKLEQNGVLLNNEFAHPLFRELTLKQLSKQQHAELARKAIQAFEDDPEKACEFIEVANLEPRAALELLHNAIVQAEHSGNSVRAMRLLAQSIPLAPNSEREVLILKAAKVLQQVDIPLTTQLLEMLPSEIPPNQDSIVFAAEFWARCSNLERALKTIEQLPRNRSELEWFGHLVGLNVSAGNHAAALALWKEHPELELQNDLKTMAQICVALTLTGQHSESERLARQALEHPKIESERLLVLKNILAAALAYQNKTQSAFELWDELLIAWADERFTSQRLQVILNSAAIHIRLGQLQRAHDLLIQGLELSFVVGDFRGIVQAQALLGDVLIKQGKYDQAEGKLLEAYALQKDKPSNQLVNVVLALSNLYMYWSIPQAHLLFYRYARLALHTAQTVNNPMLIQTALCSLSQSEINTKDFVAAREHADQALESAQKLQYPFLLLGALTTQGLVLEALGQTNEALAHFREAFDIAEQLGLRDTIRQIRFEIARLTNDFATIQEIRTQNLERGFQNEVDHINRTSAGLPELTKTSIQESRASTATSNLELLGTLQIMINNKPQTIRGQKRQELLVLLLEARMTGKSEMTRLEMIDALYPDEFEDRAASSLKELIRGTRANLGAEVIQTTPNGYALGQITSDVETFLKTLDSSLWRGSYLQGLGLSGSENVRESLGFALQNCVQKLLESDSKEAARVSRFLLEMNLYDFEHLRLSVQAFQASENYKTLGRIYNDARARFADVGEILPERWQDFLETLKPA